MGDESNMAEESQQPAGRDQAAAQGSNATTQDSNALAAGAGNAPAQGKGQSPSAEDEAALLPPVDVIEDAGGITLYADLPGVSKENLSLHLERDRLTIEGRVSLDIPQEMQSNFAEVRLARYRRVFALSKELDGEQTSAELKNGVLKLRIPKAQHAQPRKIAINVG
jgi:HSP20 family molecular chaperone IbpA